MREHRNQGPGIRALLLLGCFAIPQSGVALDMEYTADVSFHDGVWSRYAVLSIEFLPSVQEAMEAFNNPAKKAEILAGTMAAEETHPPVRITVPRLEYGMAGAFSNIRIETNDGISILPTGRIGSPSNPLCEDCTGQLKLEIFTEERLKGSYSADLYKKKLSDAEGRAGVRPFVGHVSAAFDIDMTTVDPGQVDALTKQMLPGVPEGLSAEDQALLAEIQAAGVDPEMQGAMLEQLRGLNPEMRQMILSSYNDSY